MISASEIAKRFWLGLQQLVEVTLEQIRSDGSDQQ